MKILFQDEDWYMWFEEDKQSRFYSLVHKHYIHTHQYKQQTLFFPLTSARSIPQIYGFIQHLDKCSCGLPISDKMQQFVNFIFDSVGYDDGTIDLAR